MSDTNSNNSQTQSIADYLAQLLKDRNKVNAFPNVFIHVERLIDEEITRVRSSLFQVNGVKKEPLVLPDPAGEPITLTEKVFVPVKDHPEFNFVGRILGPRGMTAKQLELETGCKIMVRGKGSMRDKKKEEQNRGKPNWEHLNEELHVLISVEDTENRAKIKMQRAIEEVKKLIIPADGEDELKKRQLMELAIINGTYRDSESMRALAAAGVKREGEIYSCGPDDFPGLSRSWTPRPVTADRSYAACLRPMTDNFANEDQNDETSSDSSSEISSDDEETQSQSVESESVCQSVRSESICSSKSTFSLRPTAPCFVPSAKLNLAENKSQVQNLIVDNPPPLKKISRRQRRKLANLKKQTVQTEMREDDQESESPYRDVESPTSEISDWQTVRNGLELSPKASKSPKDGITWQLVQFENNQISPKESKSTRDKITWQIVRIERDTLNFPEFGDSVSKTVGENRADDADTQFFYSLIPHFKSLNVMSKMRCGIEIQVVVLKYLSNEKTVSYY